MWIETTSPPSASSGSYAATKSPTEGWEVVGSFSPLRSSSMKPLMSVMSSSRSVRSGPQLM
jgi:hypothetical protein